MGVVDQLRGLSGNKRTLAIAGVAGAAGLGAIALARGGGGSARTAARAGQDEDGTAYTGAGTFPNTYGTDLASAVGELDGRYADEVAKFGAQLGTSTAALTAMQKDQAATLANLDARLKAIPRTPAMDRSKSEKKKKKKDKKEKKRRPDKGKTPKRPGPSRRPAAIKRPRPAPIAPRKPAPRVAPTPAGVGRALSGGKKTTWSW